MLRKSVLALTVAALAVVTARPASAQSKAAPSPAGTATPPAPALTVDQLIAKSVEARGGLEKMRSVKALRITGKMAMGAGMEVPIVLEVKRPNSIRMDMTVQGATAVQAYDGKNGWGINPFGKKEPEPMPAEQIKDMDEQADIDGALVDYKAKGHQVELVGKEAVEGSDAYKLKVTLKTGDVRYVYLDAESFLEIKQEEKRTIRGSELELESEIGDYKEVGGLLFPHSIQNGAKGRPERTSLTIERIELNPVLSDERFKMPAAEKAEPAK